MPPTIVLIRHAQAMHNLTNTARDSNLHDPPLSDLGVTQCQALRESLLQRFSSVDPKEVAIISSPMRRTLQTAELSISWLVEKGVPICCNADWQEIWAKPCDTGSDKAVISAEFPNVDLSSLDPVWPDKTSPAGQRYAPTRQAIVGRGDLALAELYTRPEKLIFVFSHSGFLRLGAVGWWFHNSDYRIFNFLRAPLPAGTQISRPELAQDEGMIAGCLGLSKTERVDLGYNLPDEPPAL